MSFIPLNEWDILDIKARQELAIKELNARRTYVANLEKQLSDGVKWSSDIRPEEYEAIKADAKAFLEWLEGHCVGNMPVASFKYNWSWQSTHTELRKEDK